jgi:cyclophilin family peptidyl-prolyl cis-trans isomerase
VRPDAKKTAVRCSLSLLAFAPSLRNNQAILAFRSHEHSHREVAMKHILCCVVLSFFALKTATAAPQQNAANPHNLPDGLYSEITTPKGVIVCELYYKKTPMTVANYVGLAEGTLGPEPRRPFYDGSPYHRVVAGFVLQGGGRPRGEGRGGRLGYSFPDELVPGLRHDAAGVLQMANGGPNTNGSQHCIMLGPSQRLNYLHTVFGRVVRGEDVPAQVVQDEVMERVRILRIGKEAQEFKTDEESFKALVDKAKRNDGPFDPGPEAHFYDPDGVLRSNLNLNAKLSNFEYFIGPRIVVRGFAAPPAEAEGDKLDGYLIALAEKLGVAKSGALVVHFAEPSQWHVRIGTDSVESFIAGPRDADGKKPPAVAGKTLAEAMQEFLAIANRPAEGGRRGDDATKATSPTDAKAQPRRTRSRIEPLLDDLIFRLEPAAPATE